MGCYLSKPVRTEPPNETPLQDVPKPGDQIGFPQPYQDPRAIDDDNEFPLDERDISSVSDEELLSAYLMAPQLHDYGAVTVSRVSKHLVIKGPAIDKTWQSLDTARKETVAQQVADTIEKMQSTVLNHMPVGPIGRSQDAKCQGPWFTDYGAGPFDTLGELEDWCNHKIDVGIMVKHLKPETRRFEFKDIVMTHQDLALGNLVLDEGMKVWVIDWGCAGVYPRGFEQTALQIQAENNEYADMVLERLSDRQDVVMDQFAKIAYGLSTGRAL
ncbi:kinase-like (PK-like) [Fusarium phyllophilum]|uniref:Kinase-like (PK-like) n=1 Tax=Fusarium phyllophilum TaxID=47803 RepID=A0A8H5MSC8_9HYPO|nr:kinase-like (PK-like) [Fusarium phyllophilum]